MNKTKLVFVSVVMATLLAVSCLPAVNATSYNYATQYYPENSFDYPEDSPTAIISNLAGIRYAPDGNAAYLHVQYHRELPEHSDEAFIVARMSGPCRGGVWLYVRAQPGHEGSRIMVCYSNSSSAPYGSWIWLPYVFVSSTSSQWVYVGATPTSFTYIAVCLYSEGNPYYPDHNGVYVDSICAGAYNPYPELIVPAYDNYGNPVTAGVYIDGAYRGTTGSTFSVSPGTHSIQVSVPSGYTFYYFSFDSAWHYTNPVSFSINSLKVITVRYTLNTPPSSFDLTVLGYDQTICPVSAPLYIDGQYVGTTGGTYTVSAGSHTLSVPESFGYAYYYYFYAWNIEGTYVYTTTATINMDYDKTVHVYYIFY